MSVIKWRIYCITDSKWVECYLDSSLTPSVCFENNTHDINVNSFQMLEEISQNTVQIQEESPEGPVTGGRFRCDGFEISATNNTITKKNFSWPYPVTALILRFTSEETHRGDYINCYGSPVTNIGNLRNNITSNTSVLPVVTTTGFSVGMSIIITDSVNTESLGRVTSIDTQNLTITVQNSTQYSYHKNAYIGYLNPVGITTATVTAGDIQINCNSTVIQNVKKGMVLYINDATNSERLGEVFDIDTVNSKITIQDSPQNNYAIGSYLSAKVHMIKNYKIGPPTEHTLGGGKIGGSYITKFHIISIEYTNNSANTTKDFNWYTEVLY